MLEELAYNGGDQDATSLLFNKYQYQQLKCIFLTWIYEIQQNDLYLHKATHVCHYRGCVSFLANSKKLLSTGQIRESPKEQMMDKKEISLD